jgi:hypothetical protein
MVLILVLTAVALVIAYFLQHRWRTATPGAVPPVSPPETIAATAARQALPVGLLGLFAVLAAWGPTAKDAWIPTLAANAALLALSLWLIRLGLTEDRGRPFSAGVALLLLWAVLRYTDLFGAVGGMLGASLMFFLCGGGLFGVALYWRNRKKVALG